MLVALGAGAQPFQETEPAEAPRVALELEVPADGVRVGGGACGLLVAGRTGPPELDLVIVLDVSVSTAAPSGTDVDADGSTGEARMATIGETVGTVSSDPEDSVLALEVAAARQLLDALDLRRTRVALVSFSGGFADPSRPETRVEDATTRVPLTRDRGRLEAGLRAILTEIPAGGTHMGAGVDRATVELLGLTGSLSEAEPGRARAAVLFTDGAPTLPYGPARAAENVQSTLDAAERARKARVRVSTVAIGPDALAGPVAALEIAERTGGQFVPVRDPARLPEIVREADILQDVRVEVKNTTHDVPARAFRRTPDGSFGAFIPMEPGANTIEVSAFAPGSKPAATRVEATLDPAAPAQAVPSGYDFFGNGGFEACLGQVRQVDLRAEDLRRQELRRQLLLEIEQEQARARARAAEQRKELDLKPAPPVP